MSTTFGLIIIQIVCISIGLVTSQPTSDQVIFEIGSPSTLPAGYIHYPSINAALKVYRERRNWSDAKQACISDGGRLAVVDTQEKLLYVKANKPRFSDVWVGIKRNNSDWVTVDDDSLRTDLPWDPTPPDNLGDCVMVYATRGLSNKVCVWRRPFVCEIITSNSKYEIINFI